MVRLFCDHNCNRTAPRWLVGRTFFLAGSLLFELAPGGGGIAHFDIPNPRKQRRRTSGPSRLVGSLYGHTWARWTRLWIDRVASSRLLKSVSYCDFGGGRSSSVTFSLERGAFQESDGAAWSVSFAKFCRSEPVDSAALCSYWGALLFPVIKSSPCLLYTSDAADERSSVDL